jgi:hypothetical protein
MKYNTMSIKRFLLILMAAVLVLGTADLLAQEQKPYRETPSEQDSSSRADSSDPYVSFPGDFDLGGCEQDCRSRFGVDPYWRGSSSEVWRLYAICIQDCNRAFWKDYDRRMKDLGNSEKDE